MTPQHTLWLMEKLLALALLLQVREMLMIAPYWRDAGVWQWKILRNEMPGGGAVFSTFLSARAFLIVLLIQQICALGLIFVFPLDSLFLLLLLLCTQLVSLRWRGTFNGGSDYMTTQVVFALTIAAIGGGVATMGEPSLVRDGGALFWSGKETAFISAGNLGSTNNLVVLGALWYIAVQACLSYFISGCVKLVRAPWRSGLALTNLVVHANFGAPAFVRTLFMAGDQSSRQPFYSNQPNQSSVLSLVCSWAVILFEVSFPLALVNKQVAVVYISLGLIFHFANFLIFGLNRFFFIWAVTYPALYFLAGTLW